MKIGFYGLDSEREKVLKEKLEIGGDFEFVGENFEILICRARFCRIDKGVLEGMGDLKMIATMSTGMDHIDLEECKKRGVIVCNVPCYCEDSVAEHVFALILGLVKKVFESGGEVKTLELRGKVLGVVGSGKIGLRVIELGKAFGMEVICYDIVKNKKACERLGFKYVELDELLGKSDVISLHVPLTNGTYHLINEDKIKMMKQDAVLINCSRGGVVDSLALIRGLEEGRIGGVGLDVWEGDVNEFLGVENVIITSHNAANTKEAEERVLDETVKNVLGFVNGQWRDVVK